MTIDDARQLIGHLPDIKEKLEAFCEGNLQIKQYFGEPWVECKSPTIDGLLRYPNQHRIKPEPREFYVCVPEWTLHRFRPSEHESREIIHVREVL